MHARKITKFGITDITLLLTATIWGINFTAVKYTSSFLSPLAFTWLRVLLVMVTLFIVALLQGMPWPAKKDVLSLLGLGVLGNGIYQLLFIHALAISRVADAALLVATAPAFIGIISYFRGVEKLSKKSVIGVVMSILGVAIIIFGSTREVTNSTSFLGIGLVLAAVVCWSIFTVGLQPFTQRINPVQINAITITGGMIPLLLLTPKALTGVDFTTIPTLGWVGLFYSSVISMGLAYIFWFRGVRVIGPTRTAVYANLQPAVAIVVAWILLGELPTVWQGIGAGTIIGGIILTRS